MHPTELAAPTELHCNLLSYGAPCWGTVHPAELRGTPYGLAQPNWATLHPTELHCTPLSYTVPHCAMLYPTELHCTPLCYAVPHWATLYPTELRCTLHRKYTWHAGICTVYANFRNLLGCINGKPEASKNYKHFLIENKSIAIGCRQKRHQQ
jgi:hypothetical protein